MSLADDIKISLGQRKRFNKSVTDLKCLLKVETMSFCLDKSLSFSSNNIFLYITIFIWEVWFACFSKWFWITINIKFLKVLQFGLFIQICHQVSSSLKLDNATRIFWLISLVFETSGYHLLAKVLIKMVFFYSRIKFLFSWEHVYLKCKQNYFQRLHGFSNLNWSLSSCLKLWYINFFDSNFSNFVFRNVYIIWWWSLQPVSKEFVFINENFEFIISKSMDEPPSPLKHVFCFIIF